MRMVEIERFECGQDSINDIEKELLVSRNLPFWARAHSQFSAAPVWRVAANLRYTSVFSLADCKPPSLTVGRKSNMIADFASVIAKVLIIEDDSDYAEKLKRAFGLDYKGLVFDTNVAASELAAQTLILNDEIDVYIVDLDIPELNKAPSEKVGERLVKRLVQNTDGGIIVHTGMTRQDKEDFLWGGVDDYIEKGTPISEIVAKAFAVWRRTQTAKKPARMHKRKVRTFRIGKWHFEEGNRTLIGDEGETARLSPTELAFIQYLCMVDTEIDRREFNVAVLARPEHEKDMRIDNLVYRLREKLGGTFQLISRNDEGTYKLMSVEKL